MSINSRRDSLRKSSISINTIRNSFNSFSKGISGARQKSQEILKQTREQNLFKSTLIRKDGEFFAKRRENVRRKDREDELESSSITGTTRKQGNLIQRSTRGFLGRILDFLGVVLLGWALINLPMILNKIQGLFKLIKRVVGVLSGFLDGLGTFFKAISAPIVNLLNTFSRMDFGGQRKKVQEATEKTNSSLSKLDKDFRLSISDFVNDENISQAGAYADQIEKNNRKETQNKKVETALAPEPGDREANERQQVAAEQENIIVETQTPDVEPRADGGDVEKGKPYTVGERGLELFVPEQSGTIIPNDELIAQNDEEDESELEGVKGVFGDSEKLISNLDPGNVSPAPVSEPPPLSSIDTSDLVAGKPEKTNIRQNNFKRDENKSIGIIPVRRKEMKIPSTKKKKNVIMIVEKPINQGQPSVMNGGQKSSFPMIIKQSSDKMLLDLQSVSSLKYT